MNLKRLMPFAGDLAILREIRRLVREFGIETIVKSETSIGSTTAALATVARSLHSIEDQEPEPSFLDSLERVTRHFGDSRIVLEGLLPRLDDPVLFYLDSHATRRSPLTDVLELLAREGRRESVIAVHDVRVPGRQFGFHTLGEDRRPLDFDHLVAVLERIYGPTGFSHFYNERAFGARRGILFVTPNRQPVEEHEDLTWCSQCGEDEVIADYFGYKKDGFLVDVGAGDGIRFSNSNYLLNRLNWSGILIEPNPSQCGVLRRNYAHRSDVAVVERAVDTLERRAVLHASDCEPGRSTLSDSYRSKVEARRGTDFFARHVLVNASPLSRILDELGAPMEIDFVSIDCEGMDMAVIESADFPRYRVKLLCVEYDHCGGITAFCDRLKPMGMKLHAATRVNAIFTSER